MKEISVIIPVYNIEKYLDNCLSSIEKQTVFNDLEIILVDDGSKDSSGKICDEFSKKYESVKVIHQKNQGVSAARNKGLEIAKSNYVSFVDGDDALSPNHYEEMLKDLKNKKYDLVIHDYFVKFEESSYKYRKKNKEKEYDQSSAMKELLSGGIIGNNLFDKLFKKEKIEKIRFDPNIKIGEDLYFIFLFIMNSNSIFVRPIPTYYYVQRSGSAMNSSFGEKYFDIIKVAERIDKIIKTEMPELVNYSEALAIYSKYKTLERAYKTNGYEDNKEILYKLEKEIKEYNIVDGIKYMSHKKFIGLILYKISPELYLFICKIKKI